MRLKVVSVTIYMSKFLAIIMNKVFIELSDFLSIISDDIVPYG